MNQYLSLLKEIYENGEDRGDRTGTGTRSIFGPQLKFNLREGFPIVTTKELHWKSVAHELLWFISGSTNIKYLNDNGVRIWDEWANDHGGLGPVYGYQWRHAGEDLIDQLAQAVSLIKNNPTSRRIIVDCWQVIDLESMALPPCHMAFQFYVSNPGGLSGSPRLSCKVHQRSADMFLGVPFNIASYALLTELIARSCGMEASELTMSFGDAHIYSNHFEQVEEQLSRETKPLPELMVTKEIFHNWMKGKVPKFDEWKFDDFYLNNYESHPAIKGKVSV